MLINLSKYLLLLVRITQAHFVLFLNLIQLIKQATEEQLFRIAKLVQQCLSVKGEDKPSMQEVAKELEGLKNELAFNHLGNHGLGNELKGLYNVMACSSGSNASRQHTMEQDIMLEMSSPL